MSVLQFPYPSRRIFRPTDKRSEDVLIRFSHTPRLRYALVFRQVLRLRHALVFRHVLRLRHVLGFRSALSKAHSGRSAFAQMLLVVALLHLPMLSGCSRSDSEHVDVDRIAAEMNQRVVATTLMERQGELIPRFNQPKTIACLKGEFRVAEDIPEQLRQGLFSKPATYPVFARFANATQWDDSKRDLRGLSLRVSDVDGDVIWGEPGLQDFLFNSYPALFVGTPEDFLGFMRARQSELEGERFSMLGFFLNPRDHHIGSLFTVLRARKKHDSPLDIRYFSTVPFALDESLDMQTPPSADTVAVKYAMTPCSDYQTTETVEAGENQLRAAIGAHLQTAPACFKFGVQARNDADAMPIDDVSVIWDEDDSPFIDVATVSFESQAYDDAESLDDCENSRFNPWQSLATHQPLGRMNAVRRAVYATGAYQRATWSAQ